MINTGGPTPACAHSCALARFLSKVWKCQRRMESRAQRLPSDSVFPLQTGRFVIARRTVRLSLDPPMRLVCERVVK